MLTLKEFLLYKFYFNYSILISLRLKNKSKLFKDEFHGFFNDDLISEANLNQKDKRKFQYNEITKYQLPKLLRFEDRSSMAHSIEARVPFVDHNVVEFGYSIPFEYKIHNGWTKYLIRKASEKNLPHSIAWRKEKFGFESPTSIWMKNRSQFENIVNKSSFTRSLLKGGRINGMTNLNSLWKLVNVALWAEEFNITLD